VFPPESSDDGLSGSKYVVNLKIRIICLCDGNPYIFISTHHKEDAKEQKCENIIYSH
jgi:hypothetical protein